MTALHHRADGEDEASEEGPGADAVGFGDGSPLTYAAGAVSASSAIARAVSDLRTRFVVHQGWLRYGPGEVDHDEYDERSDTQVFAAGLGCAAAPTSTTDDGPVPLEGCMRLTLVHGLDDSLSLQMWGDQVSAPAITAQHPRLAEVAEAGALFDLTRLATRYQAEPAPASLLRRDALDRAMRACFLMFGAAGAHSWQHRCAEPVDQVPTMWIFTVNDQVRGLLDLVGVEYEVLREGRVTSTDTYRSSLCSLVVEDALEQVRDVDGVVQARRLVLAGIASPTVLAKEPTDLAGPRPTG